MSEQQRYADEAQAKAEEAAAAAHEHREREEVLAQLPAVGYALVDEFDRVSVFLPNAWFGSPMDKVIGPISALPVGRVHDHTGIDCSATLHAASETINVKLRGYDDDVLTLELQHTEFDAAPWCG